MDPVTNPFAPGAGTPPPELAGRDDLIGRARVQVERTRRHLSAQSLLMVGLRGAGKTVLLDRMRNDALAAKICTIRIEADEKRSFPAMLAPELHRALLALSRTRAAEEYARRALRALASFVKAIKVSYKDVDVGITAEPEPGLADLGDLESDLYALLHAAAEAATKADTAIALFIDELQYVKGAELAALIVALHRSAQESMPVTLIGAGLPPLRANVGKAKTYAERMFNFAEIGVLTEAAAKDAITKPLTGKGVAIDPDALDAIIAETRAYPYFLQEWGKCTWNAAPGSPITVQDVRSASAAAVAGLDASFFRVRFDRLTKAEKRYLRAIAELGDEPHRSGEIAAMLGADVKALAPARQSLIEKGMLWSPSYGMTAFSVPLFGRFMQRIMPGTDWRNS